MIKDVIILMNDIDKDFLPIIIKRIIDLPNSTNVFGEPWEQLLLESFSIGNPQLDVLYEKETKKLTFDYCGTNDLNIDDQETCSYDEFTQHYAQSFPEEANATEG